METTFATSVALNLYSTMPTLIAQKQTQQNLEEVVAYTTHFMQQAPYRKTQQGKLGLSLNSLRNYHSFQQHFTAFETSSGTEPLTFSNLDSACVARFTQWLLEEKKFSENYAGRLLGALKTLCLDAKKNGGKVHPYTQHISGFTQQQRARVINILTLKDLHAIEIVPLHKAHLENVRRWLIIGFWLGQRISDLLALKPQQLREAPNGGLYVDIHQQKTDKKITVGVIDSKAVQLLREDFPQKITHQRFNLHLKEVLRLAGINQKVQGYKFSAKTHRKEWGFFPKYTVITAHDLRRSFATNFFGKIPTPVLMQMTGHSKESTFMSYIGRDPNRDAYADAFMEGVLSLSR